MTRCLSLFAALLSLGLAAAPVELDVHTLLLARFESSTRQADYALGIDLFAGNGASLTDGYYGRAIDLRKRGLMPDFMNSCSDATPRFDGWGFHGRGNVSPWQGTLECWFRPVDPRQGRLLWSYNFLGGELGRLVPHPTREGAYADFGLDLHTYGIKYSFPTCAGSCYQGTLNWQDIPGFARQLSPDNWHHLALTWSPGALILYLDGRPALAIDLTGQKGLAIVSNPVRYLNMSDCILDELRISSIVRYPAPFEPAWRDGQRPEYAFTGNPEVPAVAHQPIEVPVPAPLPVASDLAPTRFEVGPYRLGFSPVDGALIRFGIGQDGSSAFHDGLHLYRGLERTWLAPSAMTNARQRQGVLRFDQDFPDGLRAAHELRDEGNALLWRVTLANRGNRDAWLEPMLSLPLPFRGTTEFFDGVQPRRTLALPRHHDEYASTLPCVAASNDRGDYLAVGIDPTINLHEITSDWLPAADGGGFLRQGTRIVLAPGESHALTFLVLHGNGVFGTLDAIDAYHARFPELYRLLPDTSIYTYMPVTQYYNSSKCVDIKRLGYAGNFWGHGPGHDKGDEVGNPAWWDKPEFFEDSHYGGYTRRIERMWGSVYDLREHIGAIFRRSYDNFYPIRRFHTCPDLTPGYIVRQVWPDYVPTEDPLTMGQYYQSQWSYYIVNEYNTPLGAHFRETMRRFLAETKGYCPGFINDMSHAGSLFRHNDPIAQITPGRAFARDLGPFVRKAAGRRQRYEDLMAYKVNGNRLTYWSDGGSFSYTLGAYSAGIAIEGAGMYKDLAGPGQYVVPARFLVGEKPFGAMTHLNDDWIGYYLKPEEFTPATLRDYYRYCGRQLVLFCLRNGITLDPGSYMFGRQAEFELAPIMVESTVRGRRLVPAAEVQAPLWVVRSGRGFDTLFTVGNQQPQPLATELSIHRRYFPAGAPLVVDWFGEATSQAVTADRVQVRDLTVGARDAAAFKPVAFLDTDREATATASLTGDGISLSLSLTLSLDAPADLLPATFAPMYRLASATLNGQPLPLLPGEPFQLDAGKHELRIVCRHVTFDFDAADWASVSLIEDGRTNFVLVADPGIVYEVRPGTLNSYHLGFERGTANLLNEFLQQYDDEDGILDNLPLAEVVPRRPADYPGWSVELRQTPEAPAGRVRIDPAARRLLVEGMTQGDMRRAMVVLMRLVDRKYPHVGRFHELRDRKAAYDATQGVPFDKWIIRKPTRDFFQAFPDDKFWARPILDPEYEPLYADGNMDFAGKYRLHHPPFLYEPTFDDTYVYGYSGPGNAYTKDELMRQARPEEPVAAEQ